MVVGVVQGTAATSRAVRATDEAGVRPDGSFFAAMMLTALAAGVGWVKAKHWADRRHRTAV